MGPLLLRLSRRDLRFVHAPGIALLVLQSPSGRVARLYLAEAADLAGAAAQGAPCIRRAEAAGAQEALVVLERSARRRSCLLHRLRAALGARLCREEEGSA